jgi:transcriptional regulator CtsR
MEINELTATTVWQLSEEDAFMLIDKIMKEVTDKDEKNALTKIISQAFDFRTVSKSKKAMIQSLSLLGFKFFSLENEKNILRGLCKRKNAQQSVF